VVANFAFRQGELEAAVAEVLKAVPKLVGGK
jgi:hypothetical protein